MLKCQYVKDKDYCLGKLKEKAYFELENEYLKRLSPFAKIKVVELSEIPYKSEDMQLKSKQKEAEMLTKQLPGDGIIILL